MILAFLDESDLILNDDIVQEIIDKTFEQADKNGDGIIDPEEWKDFTAQNPSILTNMTIPYLRDLPTIFPNFMPTTELEDETDEI
ncbi:hypothetical protein LIER_07937 [Lithospermum erythrorhizon]|uniref:Calcineurin B-like protein n=1 Tax=Lithospermum erythrorhizon TaxID=34254 RepID=A0AAV3PEC6_LITER